jgi:hypothetical protein
MKKQTAVDFLIDLINKRIDLTSLKYWDEINLMVQQAKAIEKEQISEAYRTGVEEDVYNNPLRTGEMYYNQTFK